MFASVREISDKYDFKFNLDISIDKYSLIENDILNIFNTHIGNYDYYLYDHKIILWIGIYFQFEKKNYRLMEKYYKLSIEKGNLDAIFSLGMYYRQKNEFELMEKYLLMLDNVNYPNAMCFLGNYYNKIKNYNMMLKYYKKANNEYGYEQIGNYYENIEKDYEKMSEYYLLAVEKGSSSSLLAFDECLINNKLISINMMINFSLAIKICKDVEKLESLGMNYEYGLIKHDKLKKLYYLSGIEKKGVLSMYQMGLYYQKTKIIFDEMKKYYMMAIKQINEYLEDNNNKYYMCMDELNDYKKQIIDNLSELNLTINDLFDCI